MIVVINALSARRGGGQTYVKNLLLNLKQDNLTIYLLTPDSLKLPEKLPNVIKIKTFLPLTNPFIRFLWEKFRLPGLLKKLNANILFCPGGLVNTTVPKSCHVVTMFRYMIPFDPGQMKRYSLGYEWIRNWLLKRKFLSSMCHADLVIFISQYAKQIIEQTTNKRIKKTVVIPHGINKLFIIKNPEKLHRPAWLPEENYLLYVSDFHVYKNQLEVVREYQILKKIRKTTEKLVFVGYNKNPYAEKVIKEINYLGLQKDIIVTGSIKYENLPAVYYYSKLMIFASSCENCPNILLEAMAVGCPLIVSERQPMPEFSRDSAVYFNPEKPEDLSQKIKNIIDQPQALIELSKKARLLSESYNWENTANQTWKVITSL